MESLMDRNMISRDSKIMFVNDGSKDRTWEMIEELHDQDPLYQGVKLSRNRGHQNALLGGLMTAKEYADMVISLDADLQDDIDVIDQFVEKYYEGCDIVYGVRSARTTDTFLQTVYRRRILSDHQSDGRRSGIQSCRLSSHEQACPE